MSDTTNADVWSAAFASATPVVTDAATERDDFDTDLNTALGATPATNGSTWDQAVASLKPPVAPPPPGPDKGAAAPGDTFPAEATVTASDATNAAKLAGLGYVANPATAWTAGQKITVGTFDFSWNGTAWAAGAVPAA